MRFRSSILCKNLNQHNKFIIYGTGNFAQEIYPQLVKSGLKEKILCFMQTETESSVLLDGIPVVSISDFNCDKTRCIVLIATSALYTDEIRQILLRHEYMNIIALKDYQLHYMQLEKDYFYLETFEEYYEYIVDWYVRNKTEDFDTDRTILEKIDNRKNIGERRKDSNLIVIICGFLSARMIKIIEALKRKKYDIVMLEYYGVVNPWYVDALQKLDIQMHHCECVAEMLYYAMLYCPLVYFFEPSWGDCLWVEIMLRNKQYFGKIVLTLYDVINDGFAEMEEDRYETEKYALEHADGIVWRWFSKEYLEEKGFRYKGKSILFLDYCTHQEKTVLPQSSDSSVLKLCAAVGYGDEYLEDRTYDVKCYDWARISEILEKIGNRQDCIFHFYIGVIVDNKNLARCKQLENQYKNFKFFLGTEYNELMGKLKDYDFGCDIFIDGEALPNVKVGSYYGSTMINSVCHKHFDFLSAGLPVVTTAPVKVCEYLDAYNVVVKMDLNRLDIDNLKQYKEFYKEKVKEARKELDIDNHISKLIDFFKEV